MPQRNLTNLNGNNLRDGTLSGFFLCKNNACLQEDNSSVQNIPLGIQGINYPRGYRRD